MSRIFFNQQHKEVLDSFLLGLPNVRAGKMFGYPAYYVKNKLFACIYENTVGIKVPESIAQDLLNKRDIVSFQPMGKAKMREWIQINRKRSADYLNDRQIFFESIKFVSSLSNK